MQRDFTLDTCLLFNPQTTKIQIYLTSENTPVSIPISPWGGLYGKTYKNKKRKGLS